MKMNSSDIAYKKILEERVKDINESITKLKKSDEKVFALHTQIESKIRGLQIESEKLKKELEEYSKRDELGIDRENIISYYDNKFERKSEKQEEYRKRIDDLKELKKDVVGVYANKTIDRKIKKLQDRIDDLKKSKGRIVNTQRRIMYPKYRYNLRKQRRISLQEGKINNYEVLLHNNEVMKKAIDEKSIFSSIEKRLYDRRSARYERKIEKEREVLKIMKEKDTKVLGARTISINRRVVDKIKNCTPSPSVVSAPAI